jgi:Thiamine-binding protein
MTSKQTTTARPTCGYPGCDQLAAPAEKPGRPPEYCAGRGHTRASVTPLGTGEGVGEIVAEAVRVVRESGLPNRTDAMFTNIVRLTHC